MWFWDIQLRALGFRRRAVRYWQCEGRFGLPGHGHISLFPWSELREAGGQLVDVSAFHVTFVIGLDHVHFYYHERHEHEWEPGGHTSAGELRRLGCDPDELRRAADTIAAAV